MINNLDRFYSCRERVFSLIKNMLEQDTHCKSYEGTLDIIVPGYFDGDEYSIKLSSYLICDGRSFSFSADTFDKCVDLFDDWLKSKEKDFLEGNI